MTPKIRKSNRASRTSWNVHSWASMGLVIIIIINLLSGSNTDVNLSSVSFGTLRCRTSETIIASAPQTRTSERLIVIFICMGLGPKLRGLFNAQSTPCVECLWDYCGGSIGRLWGPSLLVVVCLTLEHFLLTRYDATILF